MLIIVLVKRNVELKENSHLINTIYMKLWISI